LRRHQLAQMLIIGAIASIIGIAVALSINWFPVQGSSQAKKIDDLYDVLLIASVPVFVLVTHHMARNHIVSGVRVS